jgi:hypothetical protein
MLKTEQKEFWKEMYENEQVIVKANKLINEIRKEIEKGHFSNKDLLRLEENCKQLADECFYLRMK